MPPSFATWMLEQEARALLTRLGHVKPMAMQESMLPAAGLLPESQTAIEQFLSTGRRVLHSLVERFLAWLRSPAAAGASAEAAQQAFTSLRLRFNGVLTHFDLFENVVTQRSENETGVWLSGLDVVSADALHLRGHYYDAPPIVCYLDRGMGGAIRRSRTRLPGGGENPVAIIKIPRERMVGSGIASSLVHEVGPSGGGAAFAGGVAAAGAALSGAAASRGSGGLAIVGALDFRNRGGLVVGGAGGNFVDLGADGRREFAASVCVPAQSGRSASRAVDPGEIERGAGTGVLSAGCVGSVGRTLGIVLPARGRGEPTRCLHVAGADDSGFRKRAASSPAGGAARAFGGAGARHRRAAAGAVASAAAALEARAGTNVPRSADCGFRRHWPGARGWKDHARGREHGDRETADALGGVEYVAGRGRVRRRFLARTWMSSL